MTSHRLVPQCHHSCTLEHSMHGVKTSPTNTVGCKLKIRLWKNEGCKNNKLKSYYFGWSKRTNVMDHTLRCREQKRLFKDVVKEAGRNTVTS